MARATWSCPGPGRRGSAGRLRRRTRRVAGHVAEPRVEHVADIDLAGRVLAASAAMIVRQIARVAASDLEPLGAGARKTQADPRVDFEIVGEHQRAGAVDDVGEADGVLEHARGRAAQTKAV